MSSTFCSSSSPEENPVRFDRFEVTEIKKPGQSTGNE